MWQRDNGNGVGGFCLKFPIVVEEHFFELSKGSRNTQKKYKKEEDSHH
jgi:hypothetical protein